MGAVPHVVRLLDDGVGREGAPVEIEVLAREEAVALVTAQASPGDLVLVVGAGDVTVLAPAVVQALGEERGARA